MYFLKLASFYLLLSLRSSLGRGDHESTCLADDEDLYQSLDLVSVGKKMFQKYNETCTSDQCFMKEPGPMNVTLTADFGESSNAMLLGRKSACETRLGYKLCKVKTTVRNRLPVMGYDVHGYVVEEDKDICFPPTCSDDEIHILDPTPGQCDPNTMPCEVIGYEVDCPSRRFVSDRGDCEDDKLSSTSTFEMMRSVTEIAVIADCAKILLGQETEGLCTASGNIDVSFQTNFIDFETDDSYDLYKRMCNFVGGQLCSFDMDVTYSVPESYLESGKVRVQNEFIKFPSCVPKSCGSEDMEGVLVHHANKYFLNNFGLECDPHTENCNVDITNIQCNDFEKPLFIG